MFQLQSPSQTEIASQITDKMLGANFLSLSLFALIIVAGIFLLYVYLDGRRQKAEDTRQRAMDDRQDEFIKTLLGEQSPMVIAQNRVAKILEQSEERAVERSAVLKSLGEKTDNQTAAINQVFSAVQEQTGVLEGQGRDFKSYNTLFSDGLRNHDLKIEAVVQSVAHLQEQINDIPNQMRLVLGEASINSQVLSMVSSLKTEIENYIQTRTARKIEDTTP